MNWHVSRAERSKQGLPSPMSTYRPTSPAKRRLALSCISYLDPPLLNPGEDSCIPPHSNLPSGPSFLTLEISNEAAYLAAGVAEALASFTS